MTMKRFATVAILAIALTACSSGPSQNKAEDAMLAYVKDNGSEDARLMDFELGKCTKVDTGYNCPVKSRVLAMGGKFDQQFNGVFTFADVGGSYKVIARVSME